MKIIEIISKISNRLAMALNSFADSLDKAVNKGADVEDYLTYNLGTIVEDKELIYGLLSRLRYLREDQLLTDKEYTSLVTSTMQVCASCRLTKEDHDSIFTCLIYFGVLPLAYDQRKLLLAGSPVEFSNPTETIKWLTCAYDKILLWE